MAATATAMLQQQAGTSWDNAWPQVTPNGVGSQNHDLLQIVGPGDPGPSPSAPVVLLNVDHAGVVHNPAVAATNGKRVGQYHTNLTSGTTAALFADAFDNPSNLDFLQVINPSGGNIVKFLDYLGVSH